MANIVNNDAEIKQYFENAQGIQRKLTPLTNKENYFKSLQNMQLGLGYSLEGETGFQQIGQYGRFYGLASYNYLDTTTGQNKQDLLTFNGWMWKLIDNSFTITRVSGNTSWGWKHYYSTTANQFRFEIIQGGAVVFSQNLGTGLEELPYNIDNLIVAINLSGIFTAAYTANPAAISNANQTVIGPDPTISVDPTRNNTSLYDRITFYNYYNSSNPGAILNRNGLCEAFISGRSASALQLQFPGYIQLKNGQGLGLAGVPAANIPLQEITANTSNTKSVPFQSWKKTVSPLDYIAPFNWNGIVGLGADIYATALFDDIYEQVQSVGNFEKLNISGQLGWTGIDKLGNNIYACVANGDIYRQLNGSGAFTALGQTSRLWASLGAQNLDMYATVDNGDIYQQFGGTGNFIALGQTSRRWAGLTQLGDNLYASVRNGDIYSSYRKINAIVGLSQTSRDWRGCTVANGNVYACVNNGDIFMQTSGAGNFNALSQTSRAWSAMGTLGANVYASVNGGDIYMQTNGTGNFNALSQTSRAWNGMAGFDSDMYATVNGGDIYAQLGGTGNFEALGLSAQNWRGITGYNSATGTGSYLYAATNTDIFESQRIVRSGQTSRNWEGMTVWGTSPNQRVYAAVNGGDIYRQTSIGGTFDALSQTSRAWRGMTTFGNNVYACVLGGDIYVQTNGTGNFVGLGETTRDYFGMCAHSTGVYACVNNGDIYKQTNGTGAFTALSQTSREWRGMAVLGNDVYALVNNGDIYKQTNGTGNFIALGQASRQWRYIFAHDGDLYATTITSGNIFRSIGGTGTFNICNYFPSNWNGGASANGLLYIARGSGDIYVGVKATPFTAMSQTAASYWGLTTIDRDIYASANGGQIYRRIGGTGNFLPQSAISGVKAYVHITARNNTLYALEAGGDIFTGLQPTEFTALSQATRDWRGMATLNNDVYACVNNGDVYKQTNGTGNFIALGQTSRAWTDIAFVGSDLYGTAFQQDIYKIPAAGNPLQSVSSAAVRNMPFGTWFVDNDLNVQGVPPSNINVANAQQAFYVATPSATYREHEGYPYRYDGRFVSRAGLPQPVISSISNTGTSTLTNVYYDYIAVARYRDARGVIVESKASAPFRINRGSIFDSAPSNVSINTIKALSGFNVAGALIGAFGVPLNLSLTSPITVLPNHPLEVGDIVFFRVQNAQRGETASATILAIDRAVTQTITLGNFVNCSANNSLIEGDWISYGLTFRVFRTKTNGVNYYFAGEAPNNLPFVSSTIPTESLQTVTTADNNLGYQYEEPLFGDEPDSPPRAKVLTVHDGRLILGQGATEPNSIYWSKTGGAPSSNLESFPALNTAVVPSTQKGGITTLISDKPGSLIVGKPTGIYVVEGDLGNRNFGVEIKNEGDWGFESQSSIAKVNGAILGVCQLGITVLQDGKLITDLSLPINPLIENDSTWNPSLAIATNDVSNKEYHFYLPYLNTSYGFGNRETLDNFIHLGLDYINNNIWIDKKYPRGMQPSGGIAVYNNDRYHLSSGGSTDIFGRCFKQLKNTSLLEENYQFHGQAIPYIVETYPMHNGAPSFDKLWIEMKLWNLFLSVNNDTARFVPFTWIIKAFLGFNNNIAITDTTETFSTVNDYEKVITFFQQPEARALALQLTCTTIKQCPRLTGFEIIFKDLTELGRFYK